VKSGWLETILTDRVHGGFVKASIAGTVGANVCGNAVCLDGKAYEYDAGFRRVEKRTLDL
jgi:hypothetical protein